MMRTCCVAVVCFVVLVSTSGAQVDSPASRLEAASTLTSLDAIDQPAWHLKLDVTMFDDKGKNPSQGTVEVWHHGTDERTVYAFGDASTTTLKHDDKTFYERSGTTPPFEEAELLRQVLHPGPQPGELDDAVPEVRKQKFGTAELTCVMLTQPIKGAGEIPLGLFPTYCIDGKGAIRFSYDFCGEEVFLNRMGTFLGRQVSLDVAIRRREVELASAKVAALATYVPQVDEFAPGPKMIEVGANARISGSVIAGSRLSFVQPMYPEIAKMKHESGRVILRATIGRDGRIHSLRPMSATNPDFVIAAIAAVRLWKYRPYLLNGEPTEVDTTITVNFELNGG